MLLERHLAFVGKNGRRPSKSSKIAEVIIHDDSVQDVNKGFSSTDDIKEADESAKMAVIYASLCIESTSIVVEDLEAPICRQNLEVIQ